MQESTASERKWTRAHDALIARVAEKGKAQRERGIPERLWKYDFPDGRREHLSAYDTNLVAVSRAGESWRTSDDDIDRTIQINSAVDRCGWPFRVEFSENYLVGANYEWRTFKGEGEIEAEARAWALWRACGGGA